MRRILAILLASGIVCTMTACSNDAEAEESSTTPVVGDFNFVEQSPITPTTSSGGMTVDIDREDGEVSGDINDYTGQGTDSTGEVTEVTTSEVLSDYKDLSTNSSLQLGSNVYVSIPTVQIAPSCTLSEFLRSRRTAYNLVAESQYDTLPIQKEVFQYGSCLHTEETVMLIEGIGFSYWCVNTPATLETAKSPSMRLFNMGTLTADTGDTYSVSYKYLGELQEEEETDFYYRAVYTVDDVADIDTIQAYAAIIYDKQTGVITTCLIATSKLYEDAGYTFTADIAINSFRYTTQSPDNIVRVF